MISQSGMVVWGEEGLGSDWVGLGLHICMVCAVMLFLKSREL